MVFDIWLIDGIRRMWLSDDPLGVDLRVGFLCLVLGLVVAADPLQEVLS